MVSINIPDSHINFAEVPLIPYNTQPDITKGINDELNIKFIAKKKNIVRIGEPYYENFISRAKSMKIKLSHEIQNLLNNEFDFQFVSFSCSFLPDKDCNFTWAQLGIEFFLNQNVDNVLPVAWNIFPESITQELKIEESLTINPNLEFKADKIEAKAGIFKIDTKKVYLVYEPEIITFGHRLHKIAWQFKSTKGKSIFGDKKNLFAIVKIPKESQLMAKVHINATVETNRKIFKVKKSDSITDIIFTLS
ncbi:MAG: hypothetical protein JXJ04_04470 [Spirochaetales bacterium]|nr:hypothetical protein [Spirochaetales bacterium]